MENRFEFINIYFGVEFFKYYREGHSVLISSGFGLGAALMDQFIQCEYFCDVDNYRNVSIDWESIGVILDNCGFNKILFVGWFTIDRPIIFEFIKKGLIKTSFFEYTGGGGTTLEQYMGDIEQP